eukprot:TRINITY_DN32785_c0_g1_i1.p1 TRINITY_DN32785_c0_g1~~TRINITY_DN32785_c0_g1_i1.p1  ORF type:complete len:550 (-),score=117.83 TRINITY_DN32785_c0_g1_i1:253-1902(-)
MKGFVAFLLAAALFPEVVSGVNLRARQDSCSPLKNHDTFSTVEVLIGTPPQKFDLVADTGSNDVIVQSCVCQESGFCPKEFGKCFRGTNKSTSFVMHHSAYSQDTTALLLSFGSGQIMAVPVTDKVKVGNNEAYMNDSLLLMVKHGLRLQGQFEGILGLGRPMAKGQKQINDVPGFLEKANVDQFSMCFKYKGDGVLGLRTPPQQKAMGSVGALHWGLDFRGISVGNANHKVSFCSPDSKQPGQETACGVIPDSGTTLMMGPEKQILSLYDDMCERWDRCKKTHQGLVKELKALEKKGGQDLHQDDPLGQGMFLLQNGQDPAAADGWGDVVKKLQDVLRGASSGGSDPFGGQAYDGDSAAGLTSKISPAETFQLLLESCEQWLADNTSLNDEMPSLFFHTAGAKDNTTQVLEMHPETFVIQSTVEVVHREIKKLMGILPVQILNKTNKSVCMPAFGKMEYPTKLNGDVWILGTPLFYEFNVHYDRAAKPPTMALVAEECGRCEAGQLIRRASLLNTGKSTAATGAGGLASLRKLSEPPVVGRYDTRLPL